MAAKAKSKQTTALTSIKGFNADWTCRGHKFEVRQTYEVKGPAECCANGFHACPDDLHPLTVFSFYSPGKSRYAIVKQSGDICRRENGKVASTLLTVKVEIGLGELIQRAVDWVISRAIKSEGSSATGDQGAASATGAKGAASATGYAGKVMGTDGNAIFAVEREPYPSHKIISVACGIVGKDDIKAGAWYTCRAGKLVEAE